MTFEEHSCQIGREACMKRMLATLDEMSDADGIIKTRQLVNAMSTINSLKARLAALVECGALQPFEKKWLDTDLPKAYLFVKKNAPKFQVPKVTRGERFEDLKVFLNCVTDYRRSEKTITEVAARMAAE